MQLRAPVGLLGHAWGGGTQGSLRGAPRPRGPEGPRGKAPPTRLLGDGGHAAGQRVRVDPALRGLLARADRDVQVAPGVLVVCGQTQHSRTRHLDLPHGRGSHGGADGGDGFTESQAPGNSGGPLQHKLPTACGAPRAQSRAAGAPPVAATGHLPQVCSHTGAPGQTRGRRPCSKRSQKPLGHALWLPSAVLWQAAWWVCAQTLGPQLLRQGQAAWWGC